AAGCPPGQSTPHYRRAAGWSISGERGAGREYALPHYTPQTRLDAQGTFWIIAATPITKQRSTSCLKTPLKTLCTYYPMIFTASPRATAMKLTLWLPIG